MQCAPVARLKGIGAQVAQHFDVRHEKLELVVHGFVSLIRAHARRKPTAIAQQRFKTLPHLPHLDMTPGRRFELVESRPNLGQRLPHGLETLHLFGHLRQYRRIQRFEPKRVAGISEHVMRPLQGSHAQRKVAQDSQCLRHGQRT